MKLQPTTKKKKNWLGTYTMEDSCSITLITEKGQLALSNAVTDIG